MTDTPPPGAAAATGDATDPSMEEILASIRRILNEEEAPPADAPRAGAPEDDVLVLDQSMLVTAPEAAADEPRADVFDPPAAAESPVRPERAFAEPPPRAEPAAPPIDEPAMLAPETTAAAVSSISGLVRTLSAGRATRVYSGGPTLEDMVRAELRPLLKEWLDEHLPAVVERLVRTEIERVVGRAVP